MKKPLGWGAVVVVDEKLGNEGAVWATALMPPLAAEGNGAGPLAFGSCVGVNVNSGALGFKEDTGGFDGPRTGGEQVSFLMPKESGWERRTSKRTSKD